MIISIKAKNVNSYFLKSSNLVFELLTKAFYNNYSDKQKPRLISQNKLLVL